MGAPVAGVSSTGEELQHRRPEGGIGLEAFQASVHEDCISRVTKSRQQIFQECRYCHAMPIEGVYSSDGEQGGGLKLMSCSLCKSVKYCSRECQAAHWKAGHKQDCKQLRETGGVLDP